MKSIFIPLQTLPLQGSTHLIVTTLSKKRKKDILTERATRSMGSMTRLSACQTTSNIVQNGLLRKSKNAKRFSCVTFYNYGR